MAQMKDIKRRISSVGNIMQITNAMELVSSAKLRKARRTLETTRPYYQTVFEDINELIAMSGEHSSVYLEERPIKNRAVIVIASDRGLAGGYNINIAKKAIELTKNNDGVDTKFYATGTRIVEILRRAGCKVNRDFTHINEEPTSEEAQSLGNFLLDRYARGLFDEVIVVYTKFETVLTLVPEQIKLLPAGGFEDDSESEVKKFVDIEFEPSPSAVLNQMIKQYVNVTLFGCLLEASASEQASRRTAMENATQNGQDLLGELELVYNRARQASITQEISEIVGGAEALK